MSPDIKNLPIMAHIWSTCLVMAGGLHAGQLVALLTSGWLHTCRHKVCIHANQLCIIFTLLFLFYSIALILF